MSDPGLPPKPRCLNLLESLVREEEEKAAERNRNSNSIDIPYDNSARNSTEFYDTDRQQITRENTSTSFTEYKMKESDKSSKVPRGDPNAGFKGKKVKKQRPQSGSSDRNSLGSRKSRPFSADYNKFSRKNTNNKSARPSTAKNTSNRTSSPKGQRRRRYSSDSDSSDSDDTIKKSGSDFDSFFDSDKGSDKERNNKGKQEKKKKPKEKKVKQRSDNSSDSESSHGYRNVRESRARRRSVSSSRSSSSYSSDVDGKNKNYTNGNGSGEKRATHVNKRRQRSESDSGGENNQRRVPVEDYSSLSSSEDESKKAAVKPPKPAKRLLSRKKKQNTIYQVNPDLFLEGKLHQKYSELEELLACSFVDQKSHVTRHHLYQMELLHDQYQAASHGHMSSATIIPRSLPEDIRRKANRPYSAGPRRPNSAKRFTQSKWRGSDQNIGN